MSSAVIIPNSSPAHLSPHAKMFDNDTVYFGANRKDHVVCRSREEAELVKLIADLGLHGTVHLPESPAQSEMLKAAVEERVGKARIRFHELAQTRTGLEDKRVEMVELLVRWFIHGRHPSADTLG
jgi:hypothetical protein